MHCLDFLKINGFHILVFLFVFVDFIRTSFSIIKYNIRITIPICFRKIILYL